MSNTVVSSASKEVTIGFDHPFVIIGERINPTGRKLLAAELAKAERHGDFSSSEKFDAILAEAEIINGFWPSKNVVKRAPKLKWVNSMLAGVDYALYSDIFASPVIVTNSSGMHGPQIAELVFEKILMFAKQAHHCFRLQQEKKWEHFTPVFLQGKTLGIVGLGSIGREVARLGRAFRMRVIANRNTLKSGARARHVDELMSRDRLPELLAGSDFVVLAVPATLDTEGLIGEAELRAMKKTAYLVNIARGSVIDEDALCRALDEQWIAGAGLDVFAVEPMPPERQIWNYDNMLFTPHVGGALEDYNLVATRLFCDNLKRYLAGRKMRNVVDKRKGY